jgi:hypothetical protein
MNGKVKERTKWILLQEKEGYPPNTLEFTIDKDLSASDALRFLLWMVKEHGLDDLSTRDVDY